MIRSGTRPRLERADEDAGGEDDHGRAGGERRAHRDLGLDALDEPAAEESARYEQALAESAAGRSTNGRDDSIALLFIQQAQSELAVALAPGDEAEEAAGTEAATRNALLSAAAVLERVLPAYDAAIEGEGAPAPAGAAEVTVTVVRWPYT